MCTILDVPHVRMICLVEDVTESGEVRLKGQRRRVPVKSRVSQTKTEAGDRTDVRGERSDNDRGGRANGLMFTEGGHEGFQRGGG